MLRVLLSLFVFVVKRVCVWFVILCVILCGMCDCFLKYGFVVCEYAFACDVYVFVWLVCDLLCDVAWLVGFVCVCFILGLFW